MDVSSAILHGDPAHETEENACLHQLLSVDTRTQAVNQEIEQVGLLLDEVEAREIALAEAIERGLRAQSFLERREVDWLRVLRTHCSHRCREDTNSAWFRRGCGSCSRRSSTKMQRNDNNDFDDARNGHNDARSHVVHQVSQQMHFQRARNPPGIEGVHFSHLLQLDDLPVLRDRRLAKRAEGTTATAAVSAVRWKLILAVDEGL